MKYFINNPMSYLSKAMAKLPKLYFLLSFLFGTGSTKFHAKICSIVVNNTFLPYDIRRAGPAIDMALERVRTQYNETIDFSFTYRDGGTVCGPAVVGVEAASVYHADVPTVFIGPGCSLAVEPLSYMAARWNIPVITPAGSAGVLADKTRFPTLTRLSFGMQEFAAVYLKLLALYGWNHVAIFYDKDEVFSGIIGATFYDIFRKTDLSLGHYPIKSRSFTDLDYHEVMTKANEEARVFVILAASDVIRKLLLKAHELKYTTGEHVIIATTPVHLKFDIWRRNDEFDEMAKLAGRTSIFVALSESFDLEYVNFKNDIVSRALRDYNLDFGNSQPSVLLTGFYDAIRIYADVLNETIVEGGDPLNGSDVARKMWNRTFTGIGGRISINTNGDKYSDFILLHMPDKTTGEYVVVGEYDGKKKDFTFDPVTKINWVGAGPPPDVPECGFRGDRCLSAVYNMSLYAGLGGGFAFLLCVASVVLFILYRKWRRQTLSNLWWWKISWEDINLEHLKGGSSTFSLMSQLSTAMSTTTENANIRDVAIYNGTAVKLTRVYSSDIQVTSHLLQEFRTIRELSHPNVAHFYGACFDKNQNVLVTEYCPKGTLQDLLGNADLSLDAQFKYSLTTDIVQGMCYLHNSQLRQHGRLRSSSCLIDNRFTVKLCDFGLPSLHKTDHTSQEFINECLWIAPEVLREEVSMVTREADVYSFGIILQEIITREAPYYNETCDITPEDIVKKITKGGNPPMRPRVTGGEGMIEIQELMMKCWAEEPSSRPTFQGVKKHLKKLLDRFGETGNLLDSLLRRMEMYATKLEKLVQDKTQELREEKKKSEKLLYEILPRSVAERLKRGLRVEPETFECVTIYFSDICGFTTISARSTPMQVVDLLNDLYTCFDAVIDHYDVYKVETIGDAYMVVSGLPQRNGTRHAEQISLMSLSLLVAIDSFRMRHLPDEKLRLRIGLHSGSVCAGVVGLKMPRYCLFGDTVNTASRMESHGEGMRIHMSKPTKDLLDSFDNFVVEKRGDMEIKGKGIMSTYWLISSTSKEGDPTYESLA